MTKKNSYEGKLKEISARKDVHVIKQQHLVLKKIPEKGTILDIGGGGEGVIGQLDSQRVIAIDRREEELLEAPPGPIKIIMDAKELKFLDETFNVATLFFTLMYIDPPDHEIVLREIWRVLKKDGILYIWAANIPPCTDDTKKWYVVPLRILSPNGEIQTGYGVPWKKRSQSLSDVIKLIKNIGFEILDKSDMHDYFKLKLQKKS